MKQVTKWHSERVGREVTVVRWGWYGKPVLLFPTAGGDAEEVERFHCLDVLEELVEAGRIKVYSCDSVGGRALLAREGSNRHQQHMLNQFHQYVRQELVPAIRVDCETPDILITAAGASIGAWNALAVLCRYPDVFDNALCMSGTYDLTRFLEGPVTDDYYASSPVHFMPHLNGSELETLKTRFALLCSGEGRAEDIGESWRAAQILGSRGVPNRVDSWGKDWPHDWQTWRKMLPKYLDELTKEA